MSTVFTKKSKKAMKGIDMTIFDRIKNLADKQGKSLQKVSEDLGLSQNYIYNLKGAKSPAVDKLALIADYFHVSLDYLLGRDDEYGELLSEKNYIINEINELLKKEKLTNNFALLQMVDIIKRIYNNLSTINDSNKRESDYNIFEVILLRLEDISYTISTQKIKGRVKTSSSTIELMNELNKTVGEINGLLQLSITEIKNQLYIEAGEEEK